MKRGERREFIPDHDNLVELGEDDLELIEEPTRNNGPARIVSVEHGGSRDSDGKMKSNETSHEISQVAQRDVIEADRKEELRRRQEAVKEIGYRLHEEGESLNDLLAEVKGDEGLLFIEKEIDRLEAQEIPDQESLKEAYLERSALDAQYQYLLKEQAKKLTSDPEKKAA